MVVSFFLANGGLACFCKTHEKHLSKILKGLVKKVVSIVVKVKLIKFSIALFMSFT